MNSRALIRWSRLHDARAHRSWLRSPIVAIVAIGGPLAAWVASRGSVDASAASHTWLAGALLAFAVAFLRVPFLVYWRADAPLLAQLPIEGRALFDAALARCLVAGAIVTAAAAIGALPLIALSPALVLRHVALATALGAVAAFGIPAVVVSAAALLQAGIVGRVTELAGAPAAASDAPPASGSSALLGALPGFAATLVFVAVIIASPWLVDRPTNLPGPIALAALVGCSLLLIAWARGVAGKRMGAILRDVSALDRQRLAALEIRPPTGLEGVIGKLAGAGALAYAKDARLVRRRFPMAFALGAIAFLVLAIVGIARPDDPMPWLVVAIAGPAAYAVALAGRLRRPPIELPRLSATLPISVAAGQRAKHAWLAGWWGIFVAVPGAFAVARNFDLTALALLAGATVAVSSWEWGMARTTSSRARSVSGG